VVAGWSFKLPSALADGQAARKHPAALAELYFGYSPIIVVLKPLTKANGNLKEGR
jgi:hypothetical protein